MMMKSYLLCILAFSTAWIEAKPLVKLQNHNNHEAEEKSDLPPKCKASDEYPYKFYLDPLGHFLMSWKLDYKTEQIEVLLCIQLTTIAPSLLTVGFSQRGELNDADLIAIYWAGERLDDLERIWIQDAHTDSNGTLMLDRRQDITLVTPPRVSLPSRQLQVTFRRPFDPCDPDDYVIDTGTTHVVYTCSPHLLDVYNLGSPFGLDVANDGMPTSRKGFQRVQLLKPQISLPQLPNDAKVLTLTVDRVKVPNDETTYWCHVLKLPEEMIAKKRHVIRFGGHITKGHEALVHHIELFHCEVPRGQTIPLYSGSCQSHKKPEILQNCAKVIAAWAMGAPPLDYPAEAGKPIGSTKQEPHFSPWVMLEVHYNNLERRSDFVDSSGVELVYTETLRPYDAGTLEVGLIYNPRMAIPPAMPLFRLEGFCIAECTQTAIPKDGIRVFASQLHTHLTGRAAYTKHIRNGIELPEINRDNHYSPHFQEIRLLPRETRIMPGDELITVCEDSTSDRDKVTLGGFAIAEEMCVNYMHYYPKIDFEVCKSTVDPEALDDFFRAAGLPPKITGGTQLETPSDIENNYQSVNWTLDRSYELQRLFDNGPIAQDCLRSNGEPHEGDWLRKVQPVIRYPLARHEGNCNYIF